jgi:Holliday junction resolvase
MTTQPESHILRAIRQYLQIGGWYVIRHQAGMGTHPGLADLQAIRDGRVVMIEVKTATGRQSAAQVAFERQWTGCGGEYILARSTEDVDCLVACLRAAP